MPLSSLLQAFRRKAGYRYRGPQLRVGLVGAGRMGQHHARHLARHPRVAFVGIADPDRRRAAALAQRSKTTAYGDPAELIGKADAAVIATPTVSHAAIGVRLLRSGVHCLIEKPLASTIAEAEELIRASELAGRVLQVGHIERFNPAIQAAYAQVRSPRFIEVSRLGPYDPRVADIGVVMDLMIHDLDIVLFLVGEEVRRVEAFGARILSRHEDIAKVRLHFASGCIADLSASRVSLERYRRIRVFQPDAYLSIDYAAPSLKVYRKKKEVVTGLRDIDYVHPKLPKGDALSLELDHFLECVAEGKTPLVSGRHGRDALELAREILANLKISG